MLHSLLHAEDLTTSWLADPLPVVMVSLILPWEKTVIPLELKLRCVLPTAPSDVVTDTLMLVIPLSQTKPVTTEILPNSPTVQMTVTQTPDPMLVEWIAIPAFAEMALLTLWAVSNVIMEMLTPVDGLVASLLPLPIATSDLTRVDLTVNLPIVVTV